MDYDYSRLDDWDEKGTVIRKEKSGAHKESWWNPEHQEWERIGIMNSYFWPDSDTYEMYTELTRSEAMAHIRRSRE